MVFSAVKNFVEKNQDLDKRLSSLKGKFKDSFQVQTNAANAGWGGASSNSPGGSGGNKNKVRRERAYQLNFEQSSSHLFLPPPLPVLAQVQKDAIMKQVPVVTEYAITPFTFYFEEIEEAYPVPNALVEEDELPQIAEPAEGMHPYGFDLLQYNARKTATPIEDVKPNFLKGNPSPMKTYHQTQPAERVLSYQELMSRPNLSNITYVCIADFPLTAKMKKLLWKKIQLCPLIETLILKNVGIGGVHKQVRLPNLRFCDFSQNRIKTLRSIRKITKYSKLLEVFNLSGNPLVHEGSDYFLRLHSSLPVLETISQKQTPVDDRIKAIMVYGTSEARAKLEQTRWALCLDNVPEIRALRPVHAGWVPQNITHITLPNSQIRYFYVGNFVNLKHLDLSANLINDITNSGFEKCDNLSVVYLQNNILARIEMLNVFEFTPNLLVINLTNNTRIENYRAKLIYITRNIKGTNRSPGIAKIDEIIVTREERIRAVEQFEPSANGSGGPNTASIYRWRLLLIERFGHKQLQSIPDYLSRVKGASFPKSSLSLCDVSIFTNVQILDFSGNQLTNFTGLTNLLKLRILYLHENPNLETNSILVQLINFERLESISFFVNDPSHSRSTSSKEYRARLLSTIIAKNRNLMLIDSTPISYLERVEAYTNAGFPREVVEKYRFFLALTVNCTMHFNREIQPDQVEIGKQYDPVEITILRRLRDWQLTSDACNFSYFFNVTEIDLSNNRLTDIANIGLQTLLKLQRLSLVNNQIQTPIPIVAQILDQLTSLEIFAIRSNPIMQTPTDRLALIGNMASMKQLDQILKVIDTEVTIFDKVEGWKVAGGSLRDAEAFKLSYITSVKQLNLYENTLVTLELADCSLEFLDLTPFINLKALLLPNNRFTNMDHLQSLNTLKDLFALDLRYNELKYVDDIKEHVLALPSLQVIGLIGNPFTTKNDQVKYRTKLLSHFTPLFQTHRYPLCILDTSEILPEEITEAALIAAKTPITNNVINTSSTNIMSTSSHSLMSNSINNSSSSINNHVLNSSTTSTSSTSVAAPGATPTVHNAHHHSHHSSGGLELDKKELSFNIAVLRRALFLSPPEALTELDLGGCGLTNLFLQRFPNLVVLNLSDNYISDNNLKESGIIVLQSLKALDLRNNRLKELGNLCRIVDLLALEILFIEENSCFDKDNEKDRIRFFKKLTNTKILGTMKFLNGIAITTTDVSKFSKTKKARK